MDSDEDSVATVSDGRSGSQDQNEIEDESTSVSESEEEGASFLDYLLTFTYDMVIATCIVVFVFSVLYATMGVWPPLQAVASGSMEPNINQGDLIVVSDPESNIADGTDENGIITEGVAKENDVTQFGGYGTVVVFQAPNSHHDVIHRVLFHVDEGEDWYDEIGDPSLLDGAEDCGELMNCPAPNSGYITKGDNNGYVDQAIDLSPPVEPDNVVSHAEIRVPWVGWLQFLF